MDPNTILTKILRRYGVLTEDIRSMQIVESKIKNKIATYADAEDAAIKIGKALRTALSENLPDALTDGRLYRAVAEVVLEQPMKAAGKDVAEITSAIQKELNEEAGLGMNPVVPEMSQDQIDGIVTGICNADSYEAGKDVMLDQVENCLEGYVDDFVRENADFQYKAGLSPTIERKISGKCCEWCAKLAGSYPYEDVSDRGNDVFRRHRNCHCQILYNPGNGSRRRQNVNSRQWTADIEPAKIAERQAIEPSKQGTAHGDGSYRAAMYQANWQRASLKDTVKKFVPGAEKTEIRKKSKVIYSSPNGRYQIVYDKKGDYFRIEDKEASTKRRYVGLSGESLVNKTEDGRTIGREDDEYEMLTHFKNTDKEGRKKK